MDDRAKECQLIGVEGDPIYIMVDMDQKKIRSHNVIFMKGQGTEDSDHISQTEDNEIGRRTRSELWGTDPMRQSEQIRSKVLITKIIKNLPMIKISMANSYLLSLSSTFAPA